MHLSVGYKRKKLAKLCFVLLLITIVSLSLSVNADATSVENTNLTPPLDVLWEYKFIGDWYASAASNDFVYAVGNQIYAFDADTGKVVWKYNTSGTAIYYHNGTVYTGSIIIYALDASDGALKWSYTVNGSLDEILIKNDALFVMTKNPAFIYALNPTSGKQIWVYNTTYSYSHPSHVNKTFLFETSRHIHALNTSTGELLWNREEGPIVFGNILFSNDITLVVTAFLNDTKAITFHPFKFIYSINVSNFETNWELKIPNLRCSPLVDKNSVYIPFHDKLESLDVITGKLKGEFEVQEPKDIDIKNGSVYVCSDDKLYSLNSTTGRLNWIFTIQDTYKIFREF